MEMFLVAILWVVNFAISYWNCKVVGSSWHATKAMGGWIRFMNWMGAIMGACGFSWCLLIIFALGGAAIFPTYVTPVILKGSLSLGYLMIIPPILFSGYAIWAESLIQAWRERSFVSIAAAGWNSFANIYNTISAFENVPIAFGDVGKMFEDIDDPKAGLAIVGVLIALLAVLGGVVVAASIIKFYANREKSEAYNMVKAA